MQEYFSQNDLFNILKQRKKCLTIYMITLAIFLLLSAGIFIAFIRQPYGSKNLVYFKALQFVITSLYVIFSFLYIGIVYNRVNKFYKHGKRLIIGERETSELDFFEYDYRVYIKDGVECKTLIFLEWNKHKEIYFERKVLVFYEKEFPQIPQNAFVKIITHGNFLVAYEILEIREYADGEAPHPPEHVLR